MIAVPFQSGKLCKRLMVLTRKFCSSAGEETIGCPSSYVGALTKLTAGKFPKVAAFQKAHTDDSLDLYDRSWK